MSSHFNEKDKAEKATDWRRMFARGYQPTTPEEIRFVRHAKMRAGLFFVYLVGFLYFNPEYSWTMTYINNWVKERRESQEARDRARITESAARMDDRRGANDGSLGKS